MAWFKNIKKVVILLIPFTHIIVPAVRNYYLFILVQAKYMKPPVKYYFFVACLSLTCFAVTWDFLSAFYLTVFYEFAEFCRKYMPILEVDEFMEYLEYYPFFKNYVENLDDITLTSEYETIDELIEILELKKNIEDVSDNMDFVLGIPTDWYELSESQQIDLKNKHIEAIARDQTLKYVEKNKDFKIKSAILGGAFMLILTLFFYCHLGGSNKPDIVESYILVRG